MQIKKQINKQHREGSVLILTVIAVLVLSLLVTGLMNIGTTELYTTQNYQLNKTSYYTAVEGVEIMRNKIYNDPDAQVVSNIVQLPPTEAFNDDYPDLLSYYITGTLKDHEEIMNGTKSEGVKIGKFEGFKPPPLPAISLGGTSSVEPVVWKVVITSCVKANKRATFSELLSGVYSVLTIGY